MKTLFILLFLTGQQLFAIISIVPVEIGAKPGISTKIQAGLDTKRGYTDRDFYKASVRITYDQNHSYVLWGEISGVYGKSNSQETTNKSFAHLRFIHALTKKAIRDEYFLQDQENKFKAIKKRRLVGGGLRFTLLDIFKGVKGYLGVGGFYEYLSYTAPALDKNENNIRINTYLSYKATLDKDSHIAYTMYYQPRINNLRDQLILNKFELQLQVYPKLFLKFSVYYNLDSSPPKSIDKNYGFRQTTTFIYNF